MINKGYVLLMARYNAWQNNQIMDIVKEMNEEDLRRDHGAFFGSIMNTLNHILWADTLWMSRFCSDVALPSVPGSESVNYMATIGEWQAARFRMDGRMRIWGETLSNLDLTGEMTWHSGGMNKEFTQPIAMCITHMFNHQTHHRGQVHAMLTSTNKRTPTTDIVFMPEDA
ncbi:DinB family protein [Sulfitobacter noctilucicola]|uniref:Putative damage-inducible protein DinB n=1 Tax=Sulfitobacter noctilucicola TaxID=1342301 RepID=A0A7W6M852_9RHOB|nr:DinB family protein [Sulfitobacter noctilucicola]KIN64967.1 DinB family protein [Sulfitobacter noctilucicola]MBB4173892.1 putative damage-inducible protein DinB [Sulfitobacter noctilucicola]